MNSAAGIIAVGLILSCGLLITVPSAAQQGPVDFDSDRWVMRNAEITEHLGRKSLAGTAYLKDVDFQDGVIEVDFASRHVRSYPGMVFRMQSRDDYERFYIRPHRAGHYTDALQYTPVFNGIAGWQLYNGDGCTAGVEIPQDRWVHLKIEVSGEQANVYIGDDAGPALTIRLKHGVSRGTIGLMGPRDGTAYFSNFSYRIDDSMEFEPAPELETPPGMITEWSLSGPFKLSEVDIEQYPGEAKLKEIEWVKAETEPSGLLDIARFVKRVGGEPDIALARSTIRSDKREIRKFKFGYSDVITIFLNGNLFFAGNSAYRLRDPSFLGIIGLNDAVHLPLEKGENELLLMIAESFGGWGLMFQDGTAQFQHEDVNKMWDSAEDFLFPETALYDASRGRIYVSNFDGYNRSTGEGKQYISKLTMDGKIENLEWVGGMKNPAGMTIYGDRLLVVERTSLVEVDIEGGRILERHPVPGAAAMNDVAADGNGNIYISDPSKSAIFRFTGGEFEEWLTEPAVEMPNGLHVVGNELIICNNGDKSLKSVDLDSGEIKTIARFGPGILDGIETDEDGNFIVSHYGGRVYRVTPSGEKTKLLDTSVLDVNSTNLEYVPGERIILVPTFFGSKVTAYRLEK